MGKIMLVHGMRMHGTDSTRLHKHWYEALRACLERTTWVKEGSGTPPPENEVDLAFWGDLFKRPDLEPTVEEAKGVGFEAVKAAYYALLRGAVRAADMASFFNDEGRPVGPFTPFVDNLVYQTAVYMHNGPVFKRDPAAKDGAFFQIQHRFEKELNKSPSIVIAHSLGTVIAYEGLCRNPHTVDTLITIGSPLATPHLIMEPLRERASRLLRHPVAERPLWPGVRQWINFYSPADVWCVPVPHLQPLFGNPNLLDVEVPHGTPHRPQETHKLTEYLSHHIEIGDAIAEALARIPADGLRPAAE